MSILIGLTGWGDHDDIHQHEAGSRHQLAAYAAHFPVVELDSAFYSIMSPSRMQSWADQTPESFSFVVKAYQAFTGHDRQFRTRQEIKTMFQAYQEQIEPLMQANKLNCLLFQFPPWFDLNRDHVRRLTFIREQFSDYPLAIEFRNRTWYDQQVKQDTLTFLNNHNWIHTICDEPQIGQSSVPLVPEVTNSNQSLVRFHGRNKYGWNASGQDNWRDVRFLYNYSDEELMEWTSVIQQLQNEAQQITILFNNNSGGHAYDNAKRFQRLLSIDYDGLNPKQMDLFSD
ncbi:uncharacterized protein YecE (DUF72 family) [Alkalibacillus flavidus]|uniref:Uncharacterized protein YecE (DUF72 family) n=1 Tax=Alkalibacillus flavidus TaxID=546021 RepID=A0ABV2KRS9_9BACI